MCSDVSRPHCDGCRQAISPIFVILYCDLACMPRIVALHLEIFCSILNENAQHVLHLHLPILG